MFVGVLLILMGADQVKPPSVDCENATASASLDRSEKSPPLLNRESCQTAYRAPETWSTAGSGMMSPVRTRAPVSGSRTPDPCGSKAALVRSWAAWIAWPFVHVTPLSVERIRATLKANLS